MGRFVVKRLLPYAQSDWVGVYNWINRIGYNGVGILQTNGTYPANIDPITPPPHFVSLSSLWELKSGSKLDWDLS